MRRPLSVTLTSAHRGPTSPQAQTHGIRRRARKPSKTSRPGPTALSSGHLAPQGLAPCISTHPLLQWRLWLCSRRKHRQAPCSLLSLGASFAALLCIALPSTGHRWTSLPGRRGEGSQVQTACLHRLSLPSQATATKGDKLLLLLDIRKSVGPDEMPPRVLRESADVGANPLSMLFEKSWQSGEVPANWKKGNIVPTFKTGKKEELGSSRPVSLTSVPGKIVEHTLLEAILKHMGDRVLEV